MACRSMTGFGQAVTTDERVRVKAEIRTVNHRFAEISVRMPREFLALEEDVRNVVGRFVARGRGEVFIAVEPVVTLPKQVRIDWELLDALARLESQARTRYGQAESEPSSVGQWLAFQNVLQVEALPLESNAVREVLLRAIEEACSHLVQMRGREGSRLAEDMRVKLNDLRAVTKQIEQAQPQIERLARERLTERMREIVNEIDEQRLLTEVAVMIDRMSVDEELVRLNSHIVEFEQAMEEGSPIGRRMDFIVQEMHREVNTVGSKCADIAIAKAVVDAKVIVEQLREQTQNVE